MKRMSNIQNGMTNEHFGFAGLLALGNCINALAGGARYVNYRDSKLTRLLKEALSGKCKTVMIAHVSKEGKHRDETKNTLVYAERANHITTRLQNPQLLEENREFPMAHYQTLVSGLREEVSRLKTKMLSDRPRSAAVQKIINEDPDTQKRKQELKYLREQIVLTFKQQMKLRRRLLEAESHLLGLELDAERQHMVGLYRLFQWFMKQKFILSLSSPGYISLARAEREAL
jgi:kinesin family member 18/19